MKKKQNVSPKISSLSKNRVKDALWGYLFISPNFLIILIFTIIPVFFSTYMSLTDWNILSEPNFVGMENYQQILQDEVARETFFNTFYFSVLSVPINLILTLLFAVFLNQKIKGIAFFRTAYYIPCISASVAVSLMFMWLLANNGLVNQMLTSFGFEPVKWLTDPKIALNAVIGVTIWKSLGVNIVIFLAGLQDIPPELVEAASIDGANHIQQFFKITLPLLSPVIFFVTITGIINSFQSFDLVYNMTEGGPGHATTVIGFYIWRQAFDYLNMGYGAALANIVFVAILILTIIQWVLRKRWVYSEE
jgi:multiple sugar transport system permease protein